jgi:hypothetical protein
MLAEFAMPRSMRLPGLEEEREAYVRFRLRLAFQALKCLEATGCFPAKHKVIWPDAYDRNLDRKEEVVVRYLATAEELEALEQIEREGWLWRISDIRHRIAVSLKALHPNAGWRRVAHMLTTETGREWLRCSHETARRWEREGVADICRMPVVGSWREDAGGEG